MADNGERPSLVEWSLILVLVAILATTALLLLGDQVNRVIPGFTAWLGSWL
ncbi:MAG: hypothetical protein ACR2MZ_11180 [Candidatus Dormibacter sp.]|uniref:hypothetical protein n=1 Tax=Candidatus Dormibacter sp. TaxID=2973982 RepID=UPI00269CF54D